MSLTALPLMIIALFLAAADADLERVDLFLGGEHEIVDQRGPIIIADATVIIGVRADLPGPIYVTGGELVVRGNVTGDVIQLAGKVRAEEGSTIGGELLVLGGTQRIADGSAVQERSALPGSTGDQGPIARALPTVTLTVLLIALAAALARNRARRLDNVANAVSNHPVVTFTVGALATMTFLSLFVFMAFTLVLIPVAMLGGLVGIAVMAYGVTSIGHLVGRRLPIGSDPWSAALGVLSVVAAMTIISYVPVVGDLVVMVVLLACVGGVLVTYLGVTAFVPAKLTDLSGRLDPTEGA